MFGMPSLAFPVSICLSSNATYSYVYEVAVFFSLSLYCYFEQLYVIAVIFGA